MKTPTYEPIGRMTPRYLADFDSTSAMLMSLGNFLRGEDFPGIGISPPMEWISKQVNKLSRQTRETMYAWSGFIEAIPQENLYRVFSEQISEWVVNNYQQKSYPAIAIGSSSGAMVHLNAALGIPWLPQSFLIPVRKPSENSVDDPKKTMEWAREPGSILLENNPDLQLHHMFDPIRDRLLLEYMTFFRVKKLRLGIRYEKFIKESLPAGATIFVIDGQRKWQTTRIDHRHYFQFGGPCGANQHEYQEGGSRIKDFLKQYRSSVSKWDAPVPDGENHEAEWGFEPSLYQDIERIAREGGYKVKRIVFDEPDHPSPMVAELYRWWNHHRNLISNRLVVGSFIQLDPYWTLRTGSVPFWMKYNMEMSARWLEEYLNNHDNYDEIFLMLFAHGVEGVGLPTVERWESVLSRAQKRGEFLGVDTERVPRDLASFVRYNIDFKEKINARYPVPHPLSLKKFYEFIEKSQGKYPVQVLDNDEKGHTAKPLKTPEQNKVV